jgi:indoleamine 2,3-dioxygenase
MDRHVVNHIEAPFGMVGTWRKYPGASAGQSPLIHSIDVALDINHKPIQTCPISNASGTVACPSPSSELHPDVNPMHEMREALPGQFQDFIKDLANGPSIRNFCQTNIDSPALQMEFNRACEVMREFRSVHLQLAANYIVIPQRGSKKLVGTGGTDLVSFLKQVRNETENAII